jgi:glycosyltransferase involved in cell wall biosynthesis
MRILFVSTHLPSDFVIQIHGVYKRMRTFVDAIKEIAQLDMLFYVPPGIDDSPLKVAQLERSFSRYWDADVRLFLCPRSNHQGKFSKWRLYGAGALSFFRQAGYAGTSRPQQVRALEDCLVRKPDAIFAHKLESMCPLLLTREKLPPVFFDLDDIEHVAFLRGIDRRWRWRSKLLSYSRVPALLRGERQAIRLAHRTFVCSESDQRYLTHHWRLPGVVAVPNAVTLPDEQPVTSEQTLLFIGSYRYQPNVEAAEFLIEKVWPRVRREVPDARLIIAGSPAENIRGYGQDVPGVEFTGFVDDLTGLYGRSRVVCAPILSGAGTRVKIIEAAAFGKPIVATRIGAEGLAMEDGREFLARDDPVSFAQACIDLLQDSIHCERLGKTARQAALSHYDRAAIVKLIQSHFKEADLAAKQQVRIKLDEAVT